MFYLKRPPNNENKLKTRVLTIFVLQGIMAQKPMLAKPTKTLELHNVIIQFLKNCRD